MTDVDAAQLKLTLRQIFLALGFLFSIFAGAAGGIVAMTTWRDSVNTQLNGLQKQIDYNKTTEEKNFYYQDQKLLWIMENMQQKKNSQPYIPPSMGNDPHNSPMHGPPQSRSVAPNIAIRNHNESINSPAYTAAMR